MHRRRQSFIQSIEYSFPDCEKVRQSLEIMNINILKRSFACATYAEGNDLVSYITASYLASGLLQLSIFYSRLLVRGITHCLLRQHA